MIKLAQSFGFTLAELQPEMRAIAEHGLGSVEAAQLLVAKLADVDARIAILKNRRAEMAELLKNVCPVTAKT